MTDEQVETMIDEVVETELRPGPVKAMGILCMLAGLLALGAPFAAGTTATVLIGVAILVGGIFELLGSFKAGGWKAGLPAFLGGALAILCGGLVLSRPLLGLAMLTLILIAYFLVDGLVHTVLAFKLRPLPGWGLMLVGGVVTILLAVLIWKQWPWSGVWAIGTLLGIRLLFSGGALLALGMEAGRAAKTRA